MQRCSIKISNLDSNYKNYKEFDSAVENILFLKYGEEFIFEFDVWWRQANIDYSVRNYPLDMEVWDVKSKSSTTIWETANGIDQFMEYFFNHTMFLKFKHALEEQGWAISSPVVS